MLGWALNPLKSTLSKMNKSCNSSESKSMFFFLYPIVQFAKKSFYAMYQTCKNTAAMFWDLNSQEKPNTYKSHEPKIQRYIN